MIKEKEYDLLDEIEGRDENLIEDFFNYKGDLYIGDMVSEIADSNVDIYTYNLWKRGKDISQYVEEALDELGTPMIDGKANMVRILQQGQYYYNERVLYKNLDNLIYNYAIKHLNENSIELSNEQLESLENVLGHLDNNNTFDDIIEYAEHFEEIEYQLEQE